MKRVQVRQQEAKPIIDEFFDWIDRSPFFGKNAIAKAAEYTLSRAAALKIFLDNGLVSIDNNPAENTIRPNVIGRQNWLFSVSEAGAKANAVCLSLAETAKANGIEFRQYLVELMTELPNLPIHRDLRFHKIICLGQKIFRPHVQNSQLSEKSQDSCPFVVRTVKVRYFLYFWLTIINV